METGWGFFFFFFAGTGRYRCCLWLGKRISLNNILNMPHVSVCICELHSLIIYMEMCDPDEDVSLHFSSHSCLYKHMQSCACVHGDTGQTKRFVVFSSGCTAIDEVWIYLTSNSQPDEKEKEQQPSLMMFDHGGSCFVSPWQLWMEYNVYPNSPSPISATHAHRFHSEFFISIRNAMQVCFIALFVMNCLDRGTCNCLEFLFCRKRDSGNLIVSAAN